MMIFLRGLESLSQMGGSQVEQVLLERLQVGVLERPKTGKQESQVELTRLGGVEQAARGNLLQGVQ